MVSSQASHVAAWRFADAIFDGRATLGGVEAIRVDDPDAVPGIHRRCFAAARAVVRFDLEEDARSPRASCSSGS
jgi:hypothetical protein